MASSDCSPSTSFELSPHGDQSPKQLEPKWASSKGGHYCLDDFEIVGELGSGQYGDVYMARLKENRMIVAIKVVFKSGLIDQRRVYRLEREIEIQSSLEHPNIVQMLTYFWDESRVFLVLEYAPGGELYKKLYKCKKFPGPVAGKYIHEIAKAIHFFQSNDVIHRDIKLENLLIGRNEEIKVADFGFSVRSASDRRRTRCGTKDYMAPELINDQEYGKAVDLWAIGVVCFEMLAGRVPFDQVENDQKCMAIREGHFKYPKNFPLGARDLVDKLLVVDPKKRISSQQIMEHKWVQQMVEIARANCEEDESDED